MMNTLLILIAITIGAALVEGGDNGSSHRRTREEDDAERYQKVVLGFRHTILNILDVLC